MNPSMASFMLNLAPKSIFHPQQAIDSRAPLNNGATIPLRGYLPNGSKEADDPKALKKDVRKAIRDGWRLWKLESLADRHVNDALSEAVADGTLPRSELFIVAQISNETDVSRTVKEVVDKLLEVNRLDYIDLLLSPDPDEPQQEERSGEIVQSQKSNYDYTRVWKDMEQLPQDRVKGIGIKGGHALSKADLEELLHQTNTKPAVVEVLTTAESPAEEVIDFCRNNVIHVLSRVHTEVWIEAQPGAEELIELRKKHKADTRIILISWHLDQGHSVIASDWNSKDGKRLDRIGELSDKETQIIDELHRSTNSS